MDQPVGLVPSHTYQSRHGLLLLDAANNGFGNKNAAEATLDLARFAEVLHTPARARDVPEGRPVTLDGTPKLPARSVKIFEIR
jgi:Cyclo-malto-dextrinase C-terminal domain